MAEWAIETHDLTKRYGYRAVLSGVDLCVKPGEFVVLFGPNGAGPMTAEELLRSSVGGSPMVANLNRFQAVE